MSINGSTAIPIQLQKTRPAEWSLRGPLLRPDERRFTSPTSRPTTPSEHDDFGQILDTDGTVLLCLHQ